MNISIVFSFNIWCKINLLNNRERQFLLTKIKYVIESDTFQAKVSKLNEYKQKTLLRFTYQSNYKIIATLFNQEKKEIFVKVIDFIEEKDSNKYNYNYEQVDDLIIENISIEETIESNQITQQGFWNSEKITINLDHFKLKENDFWNYTVNEKNNQTIYTLLSNQQNKYINKEPDLPILLQGNHASGKTHLAIYSALNHSYLNREKEDYKIFYVTSNSFGKNSVQSISNQVSNQNVNKISNLKFNDYQSLCKYIGRKYQIIGDNEFLCQRQITAHKFVERFCATKNLNNIKPLDLWQEIRNLIKGSIRSLSQKNKLISLDNYLALKNQSIFSSDRDYNQVYDLAVKYQNWLESQKCWDELDLTHYIFNKFSQKDLGVYNAVYVDEIQDFTELQIQLILKFLKVEEKDNYLPKFFLSGQPEKVVNVEHFNWNKVTKIIIDLYSKTPQWLQIRKSIEPQRLNYNLLSSNTIIDLKSAFLSLCLSSSSSNNQLFIESSFLTSAHKPLIIFDEKSKFFDDKKFLGINNAIIVFNEEDKEELANYFTEDKERILTINQIKDLKFDEVLVWNFFSKNEDTSVETSTDNQELASLKYYDLSTCVSTAKNKLYFYDQKEHVTWNLPQIQGLIEKGDFSDLKSIFGREYSQEEIVKTAKNFTKQGVKKGYEIAIELFKKAEEEIEAKKVEALLEEEQGNWSKAGDIWNNLSIFEEAIRCWNEIDQNLWKAKWASLNTESWIEKGLYFEDKKDYYISILCYEKAENLEGILRCLEATNQWELAGDKCQEKTSKEKANKYYEVAEKYYLEKDNIKSALDMWIRIKNWEKAALILEGLKQWQKAADYWLEIDEFEKSALCLEKIEKWSEARKCWLKVKKWDKVALCYEFEQKWQSAIEMWEKINEKEKIALCYQKSNQWEKAESLWRELGYWGCVAIALQQQEKWAEASIAWQQINPLQQEALCYEQSQQWDKAQKCWLELKNWRKIIIICEKQGKWVEAAESWENLGEWKKSALAWLKTDQFEKAALCYEEGEYWEEAEKYWRQLNQLDKLALNFQKQEKWQRAAQIWEKTKQWHQAGKAWRKIDEIEKAALCYEEGEYWREAEECWSQLQNWERVEMASAKQGRWQKAAYNWLQSNQLDKAALCYEKAQDWAKAEKYWRKLKNWTKIADVCEQQHKWEEAAQAYLKVNSINKAASCFEQCKDWVKAEECWRQLYKWDKVAAICESRGDWEKAGNAWLLVNEVEKAGICFEKLENWAKAEECWRRIPHWEKLGSVCEYQEKWEEAAQIWQFLSNWEKAALASLEIDDVEAAAKYYEKGGDLEKARACRRQLLKKG